MQLVIYSKIYASDEVIIIQYKYLVTVFIIKYIINASDDVIIINVASYLF